MTTSSHTQELLPLFLKFITESRSGRRLQKNGTRINPASIKNYEAVARHLAQFSSQKQFPLQVQTRYSNSKRQFETEKRYWKKFYRQYTDYLYSEGFMDNYVGLHIKVLRTFFNYLKKEKGYDTGSFSESFYVLKEEPPIVVLSQEQLRFLISDCTFEESLPPHLRVSKDVFVIGCTVGLRISDLNALKPRNLERTGSGLYIVTSSQKTHTPTRIKLPPYAVSIIEQYAGRQATLLPVLSLNQFNKNIKAMALRAGWTYEVGKPRSRRGQYKELKTAKGRSYRFCDLLSSHTMRKTAITTMLMLGMPEPLVRKVSGHAANSREFYRYVRYSQSFVDTETDRVFERLV